IEKLSTGEVLTWGVPAHVEGNFLTKADLANLNGGASASTIARTRDAFTFAPTMGWLMLDCDYVKEKATLDSLRETLVSAVPGLTDLPLLGMSSASANVGLNSRTDFIRGLTGARFYLPVADARQIP